MSEALDLDIPSDDYFDSFLRENLPLLHEAVKNHPFYTAYSGSLYSRHSEFYLSAFQKVLEFSPVEGDPFRGVPVASTTKFITEKHNYMSVRYDEITPEMEAALIAEVRSDRTQLKPIETR